MNIVMNELVRVADRCDAVIGVDTHTDTHTAVIIDARGGILAGLTVPATAQGYGLLLDALLAWAPGPRVVWAIEGTGSYGAGLAKALAGDGAEVIEVRAVSRPRGQGKNDAHDAAAIARAVLAQDARQHARPRRGEIREALRILTLTRNQDVKTRTRLINSFKSLVLTAAGPARDKLRDRTTTQQLAAAAALRVPARAGQDVRASIQALRATAAQIRSLTATINAAERRLDDLTTRHAAPLRALTGAGPISAAQILLTFSHPGRFHSEAAFAAAAGTSPLEASSGRTTRHRLNRTGDRQLTPRSTG